MKKILLAMAALLGCATMSFAQNNYVATLQHEGEFTHYYGADALKSAYNAADEGDIITLSPGTFSSPGTIDKGITLRGAGIDASSKSTISGETTFISEKNESTTWLEGIVFKSKVNINKSNSELGQGRIALVKNQMSVVNVNSSPDIKGTPIVRFYNDIISELSIQNYDLDLMLYSCSITDPYCSANSTLSTTALHNCVINWKKGGRWAGSSQNGSSIYADLAEQAYYLNFYNCIFVTTIVGYRENNPLPNSASAYNCLSINRNNMFDSLLAGSNNKCTGSSADVFENGENYYVLTNSAQGTYLGTDGTQIGLYGGNYPYNTKVQYPVITQFSSDVQTSKEGILNINIEVDGK